MADKMYFTKDWYNEIMQGDEFVETTPQELSYLLYAAAIYSFTGEKTNIGEVFGREYAGLNRTMSGYYGQIDRMITKGTDQALKNQKYDNEAIKVLAAQGKTQKEICQELNYDVSKSKSLSSNPGYQEGRKEWLAVKALGKNSTAVKECASTVDSCQETSKNCQENASYLF